MSFTKKVVTTYSKSLFQSVKKSQPKNDDVKGGFDLKQIISSEIKITNPNIYIIGEELSLIRSAILSSKKLNDFFNNPTYPEQQKYEVLGKLFQNLTPTMKSFLKILEERSHLSFLPEVGEEYNKLLLAFRKSAKVKIITANILQEEYGINLLESLRKLTSSTEIVLNISYNPKLLGGLILEYNSSAIDASILKEFSLFFNEI